jgi:hypothetical protein
MYCQACLTHKPEGDFYASKRNRCKECTKKSAKAYRLAKLDHCRAYDKMRASMPHRKALAKQVQEKWRTDYPNRRAANVALGNAIRNGRVKKQPCWVCGGKAVAHHPDYSRPLDVVWLCQPHHKQAHALVANDEQRMAA